MNEAHTLDRFGIEAGFCSLKIWDVASVLDKMSKCVVEAKAGP